MNNKPREAMLINIHALAQVRQPGSHPCKTERILDPGGDEVGKFTWAIVPGKQRLNSFINFGDNSFDHYREKIPLREIWPMAVLHNLEVLEENRGRGFGKNAIGNFLQLAKEQNAVSAFLRVSNGPGDQLEKNLHIFKSHGWILLDRNENDNYFMYHDLNCASSVVSIMGH
jgi:GNAT superfamily N-acetyltransferase